MQATPVRQQDPVHDVLRIERRPLDPLFAPDTIAVIGASETAGSVGRSLMSNLTQGNASHRVFPVNPNHSTVFGLQAYPNIGAAPVTVDLAVVATPAEVVPQVIRECVEAGVKAAIVISAGFKESGTEGAAREHALTMQLHRQTGRQRLRLIGPNCFGVMRPSTGLNATFARSIAQPGNVAFISQSGALCSAILDWSERQHVGFSAFVSVGSMADVDWGDVIDYLGDDPLTESILIYMESVGDARAFLSAARAVALTKPIIVIKPGRTSAAAKAAASHTGSLTGNDAVLDAAFQRCGVLRVNTIADLFDLAQVLAKQRRPHGPRLTIVTNAGGPGVLATDALVAGGGELAVLSDAAVAELDRILPPHWSHANPVDILGDADGERYAKALEVVTADPSSDGLLVVFTPQDIAAPEEVAERVARLTKRHGKPILASWMGGSRAARGEAVLNAANIPTYPYPDTAAHVFCDMWRYSDNLRALYETPVLPPQDHPQASERLHAKRVIDEIRSAGRTLLTEVESKQLLMAYGIPIVETRSARSAEEAVHAAAELGYPVVVKLLSQTITHKTDVGGVALNLPDAAAVDHAFHAIEASTMDTAGPGHFLGVTVQPLIDYHGYELILGSSADPQFGPVLLFGTGGQLVEVLQDRALGLPPLNTTLARRMMEQTRVHVALRGVRGRQPVDLAALEQLLVRFSQLVVDQPAVKEIEINPLLAAAEGLVALDARVVLHADDVPEDQLPRPAIRPYPMQYVSSSSLADGTPVVLRPIRAEDEPLMVRFHQCLSENSVYLRYFHLIRLDQRIEHDRLTRICFIDYDREIALVAEHQNALTGEREILGVGRLSQVHGANEAEFAILVADPFQGKGLGTQLLRRLIVIARDEGLKRVTGEILPENGSMRAICQKLGFRLQLDVVDSIVYTVLDLDRPPEVAT